MLTSIVILTFNQLEYTKMCINSIRQYTKKGTYEIIVVDNASNDGTVDWLKQQTDIKSTFNKENLGFPKGCNQGIEIAKGENILLLNNDTIVTQNWLNNLLSCLYSSDDIGAVGPVTNSASYYSTVPVNYKSIAEMQKFCLEFNNLDSEKWEERLKLIGFCMLIKKEAIDKIGILDERFTPGNFEDDDYSLRLRHAGYRLMLCKDTFIHHFGSISWKENVNAYSGILSENEKKFKEKWGTESQSYGIELEMIEAVPFKEDRQYRFLHIGCGSGATLLKLKKDFPKSELYGVESNPFAAKEASHFSIIATDIECDILKNKKFDIIFFSCCEIQLDENVLGFIKEHLYAEGYFFAKVQNANHYSTIYSLLNGQNPLLNKNALFSLAQMDSLANVKGFEFSVTGINSIRDQNGQKFLNKLVGITGEGFRTMLESTHYFIRAKFENSALSMLLDNLVYDTDGKYLHNLNEYEIEDIILKIKDKYSNSVKYFNRLAIGNFSNGNHDYVLPYLHAAFNEEPNNVDTLYNLAFMLYKYGEIDLAIKYLSMIHNQDEGVQKLIAEINGESLTKSQEITFLLRRVEFDIDIDETKNIIIQNLLDEKINEKLIEQVINTSIINKIKVLQFLAIICFEHGMHEQVLPYLKKAYELDTVSKDTLYNLGYVLAYYGELKLAERFLKSIQEPNDKVQELLKIVRGATE